MEEEDEHLSVVMNSSPSSLESNSMLSATVGRVMSNLLSARPKKLQDAVSRLDSPPKIAPIGVSLEQSLWFLHNYVRDAAEKEEHLDQILVPMLEHSLKCKDLRHGNQAILLLNWLFQDELIFQVLAANFAGIILRKNDRYISLGWCTLARGLVEYDMTLNDIITNGIKEKYNELLKILCSCIKHLLSILCNGSIVQGGFELPTRLSVAAADFILSLTLALTRKDSDISDNRLKSSKPNKKNLPISLVPAAASEKKVKEIRKPSEVLSSMEIKLLLWDHLDDLINLVRKLIAWSRKSRTLHAKGLERVLKWLQGAKETYGGFQNEAGSQMHRTGALLLSSCWKHYGLLLHLEDSRFSQQYRELLEQYLSGIQFYADNYAEESKENKDSGIETTMFFLNCLSLLLGRLDGKQFEKTMIEFGPQMSQVVISQLRCSSEDVVDGAVSILKAAIFRTNHSLPGSNLANRQMDAALPLLLNLLDERDSASRAVVSLVAEYCSRSSNNRCIQEVLKRLDSGNVSQRRNAFDVISELVQVNSENVLSQTMQQDIASHLLDCLGDEDLMIQTQVSNLIPMMDPSLVMPALVRLVYSSDERIQSVATNAFIGVLKYHGQKYEVICMLLNCLSNLCKSQDNTEIASGRREGLKLDTDTILKLIPEWSKTVKDWNSMVGPLIDKMFEEPSNAIIVKFLSYISEHLAVAADVVYHRILLHTEGQNEIGESFFSRLETKTDSNEDDVKFQNSLFDHLCPLLIIRLLPLRIFDDVNSSLVYGELLNQHAMNDSGFLDIGGTKCIVGLLLNRTFNRFEFEDVRKLGAELCGRIHPLILFPIISSQLEDAVKTRDILKIKASVFSICTSLVVRGRGSILHPAILKIRKTIENVLLWPSLDGDEVSKAQRGCIDCLALMVCTELQDQESPKGSTLIRTGIVETHSAGDVALISSIHAHVVHQLTLDMRDCESAAPLSYRLCMANVLISACQKISESGKKRFSKKIIPRLIRSVMMMEESEIRAACIQVLFPAVYHLKTAVLPYTSDLLKASLKSLREGSEKERMAGAKLLASLLASEEAIVGSIAGGLLEARTVLSHVSFSDPSPQVQQVCRNLLLCLTSP